MTRARKRLLIVFLDLSGFKEQAKRQDDEATADVIDAYYERVASAVQSAHGTLVKFIGDAALAVFPERTVDGAVKMLLELKPTLDKFMEEKGWDCQLSAKVHFGEVIAGQFGPKGDRRYDIIGRAVNATAMLKADGITLSDDAKQWISPALRKKL